MWMSSQEHSRDKRLRLLDKAMTIISEGQMPQPPEVLVDSLTCFPKVEHVFLDGQRAAMAAGKGRTGGPWRGNY